MLVKKFISSATRCAYLPDQQSTLEYRLVTELSGAEYEAFMNAGWRKFGPLLFQPVCLRCSACQPIRIPVAEFRPDRSQRRALRANAHLEIRYGKPELRPDRLDLYRRYHDFRTETRGWSDHDRSPQDYLLQFVVNPVESVEVSLWNGGQLVAVVITDITPDVVSGVYHFYEPTLAGQSIGTFCMLQTIELARNMEKSWAYFGYYVDGCGSLSYKARFKPCELLGPDGIWSPLNTPPSGPNLSG